MNREETLMSRDRFKKIMTTLIEFKEKEDRVTDFVEKEIATDSWFILTYGHELVDTLINMLADEFNCWFDVSTDGRSKEWWAEKYYQDNDISYWLYDLEGVCKYKPKSITIDGEEVVVDTLDEFYDYLVKYYKDDKN